MFVVISQLPTDSYMYTRSANLCRRHANQCHTPNGMYMYSSVHLNIGDV